MSATVPTTKKFRLTLKSTLGGEVGYEGHARAIEALERARRMKPGAERNEALKKAGQLQTSADIIGYLKSKELQPPK
jgi:hypothetical protein